MYTFPARFVREAEAINVTFPDLPEALTCGSSEQQAQEYAVDALESVLAEYVQQRKPIPAPSSLKGRTIRAITPSAVVQAKLALYSEMQRSGLKKAELARKLGWQKNQVERLLDLRHASRMNQIEAALNVVGKNIVIDIANAA